MLSTRVYWVVSFGVLCVSACGGRRISSPSAGGSESLIPTEQAATPSGQRTSGRVLAGASCEGRDDCPSDQVCVDHLCRYRRTSASGEILASAARALASGGDAEGALRTFDQAIAAFEKGDVPVPPEVLCMAAESALRIAKTAESRENAAKRADACFRQSFPGDQTREAVRTGLARLRYDGLDLERFDRNEPADRFFTLQPSRPTLDAIEISLEISDRTEPGFREVRDLLRSEGARRVVADCFVQDWELRHERTASANVTVSLEARLRDMGDYDVFQPTLAVQQTTAAVDGFEHCLAVGLPDALAPLPRLSREFNWREPITVAAHLQ